MANSKNAGEQTAAGLISWKVLHLVAAASVLAALASSAGASIFTLGDGNATITIDTGSQAGVKSWVVDGVENLETQWFWYRVGATGPEASIDTLPLNYEQATDTNGFVDTRVNHLFIRYGTADTFWIDIDYGLTGGAAGSLVSSVSEGIDITNNGSESLDFHIFQYTDFDLGGSASDDEVEISEGSRARQWDDNQAASETIVTTSPSGYEANIYSATLTSLTDTGTTNFGTGSVSAGPGNATWAFQWDMTLSPGQTIQISKIKNLTTVPEPGTLGLLCVGLVGVLLRRRTRRQAR